MFRDTAQHGPQLSRAGAFLGKKTLVGLPGLPGTSSTLPISRPFPPRGADACFATGLGLFCQGKHRVNAKFLLFSTEGWDLLPLLLFLLLSSFLLEVSKEAVMCDEPGNEAVGDR